MMNNERVVELNRWPDIGFGFSIIGGIDTHIPPMVCALVKNSPALVSGKVFVGDVLCKVNGVNVLSLETRQVVDLIRNCKEKITLSLKEDRLSKLKARPFLAEDALIDPPGANKPQPSSQPTSYNRTVGSSYQYDTDGKNHTSLMNTYLQSSATSIKHVSTVSHQPASPSYQVKIYPNNLQQNRSPVVSKALVYDLDNLPRSPREVCSYQQPLFSAVTNQDKYASNEYYSSNFNKTAPSMVVEKTSNVSVPISYNNVPRNTPPTKSNNRVNFEFSDGHYPNETRLRPQSNPDLENNYPRKRLLKSSESYGHEQALSTSIANQSSPYRSNYSSPNVFEDSDQHFTEGKNLTLNPTSYSVQSLNNTDHFNNHSMFDNDTSLSPLTLQIPSEEQSMTSSMDVSPSVNISQNISSTSGSASPADIASRLFSLNGYQDKDVAPLLGKNNDFSQQTCREYLRFFAFEGLSLDDALRVFLQKFSLTGETQERERILIHFSKRYHECNNDSNMSEDAVHTLVCSLMLLNTDLHGQSIQNRMSLNDFVNNLSGLCDDHDFSKEQLKTLYNSIKTKEIIFSRITPDLNNSPKSKKKVLNVVNPFVELTTNDNDAIVCEGLVYRKSVMDSGGRRTSALKRSWRSCHCVLKGLVLLCYKPENIHSSEPYSIGIHHSLAGYAKDYKKRVHVFKLITSYWSVYYIQVKSQDEVRLWMDSLNMSAALLSSPPLPAPCGSSLKFQRPVMPVSRTKLSLNQQVAHHNERVQAVEIDLNEHMQSPPDPQSKYYLDWESKLDYLEFELKRFKAYSSVLTVKRLESMRNKILKNSFQATIPDSSNTLPKVQKSNSLSSYQNVDSHSSL